jgi:hypothetical protein
MDSAVITKTMLLSKWFTMYAGQYCVPIKGKFTQAKASVITEPRPS